MPLDMDKSEDTVMGNTDLPGSSGIPRNLHHSLRPPISLEPTPLESTPELAGDAQSGQPPSDDDESVDSLVESEDSGIGLDPTDKTPLGLPIAQLPSGLCYDDRMRYHAEIAATSDFHPEDPRRIYYIFKELCQAGLVDDPMAERPIVPQPLRRIAARPATREEVLEVHEPVHWTFVESTQYMDDERLLDLEATMDSIYFNRLSYESGLLSCGGAIETCKAVVAREVKNAIAVIRPPGHHAEPGKSMGFCLFNNVCVAAKTCQRQFPDLCRKILILDWDVHHGNGIQTAFYDDPNILYISIHVYQDGRFYPGGVEGDMDHCGSGPGIGKNINIPWKMKGMGDGDYMFAFQQVVMPVAMEFSPDLVIVSAGFDAAAGDDLGGCHVSPACYAHMTHMLMSLSEGKIAVCLEGGYNFRSISKSALAVTRTLMGEPPDRLAPTSATESAVRVIRDVCRTQSRFWRCMFPREPSNGIVQGERMHDILREWQAKHYWDKYRMNSLYIFRNELSKSFKDQVLATPNFDDKKNLLVVLHDPPDTMGMPDPTTGKLELHNTWVADTGCQAIIKWAIDHDLGVLDVNIPLHVTDDSIRGSQQMTDIERRKSMTEMLAFYLWDNYIEVNDHDHVILMGIGNAFYGIARLLTQRETTYQNISGVISFVADNPLLPVKNSDNPWLQKWYYDNSLVFVAPSHQAWAQQAERKVSKRYGHMIKSDVDRMSEMLLSHRRDVTDFVLRAAELDAEEEEETQEEDDVDELKAEDTLGDGEIQGRSATSLEGRVGSQSRPTSQNGTSTSVGSTRMPAPIHVPRETVETPPRSAGLAADSTAMVMVVVEDVNATEPNSASSMADGLASTDSQAGRE